MLYIVSKKVRWKKQYFEKGPGHRSIVHTVCIYAWIGLIRRWALSVQSECTSCTAVGSISQIQSSAGKEDRPEVASWRARPASGVTGPYGSGWVALKAVLPVHPGTTESHGRERKRTAWNFAVRVEVRPSSGEKGYRSCYSPAGRSRSSGDKISELKRDRCFLTRGT
jgi:hypothetical protein